MLTGQPLVLDRQHLPCRDRPIVDFVPNIIIH